MKAVSGAESQQDAEDAIRSHKHITASGRTAEMGINIGTDVRNKVFAARRVCRWLSIVGNVSQELRRRGTAWRSSQKLELEENENTSKTFVYIYY